MKKPSKTAPRQRVASDRPHPVRTSAFPDIEPTREQWIYTAILAAACITASVLMIVF